MRWTLIALPWLLACRGESPPKTSSPREPAAEADPAAEPTGHDLAHDHDHDHEHEHPGQPAGEPDRPLPELLADRCEHDLETYRCAECRYEVGVVRVPGDLLQPADGEAPLLQTTEVTLRRFDAAEVRTGEVAWAEDGVVHVAAPCAGSVHAAHADLGRTVAAGDLLVEIDSREAAEAQSEYLGRRATLALTQRVLARERALVEQGIAAGQDRHRAEAERDAARIALDTARDRLRLLGFDDAAVAALENGAPEGVRGRLELRAPQAGVVIDRHASRGEAVGPDRTLFVLADTLRVWVWIDVRESDLAAVLAAAEGGDRAVEIRSGAFPGRVFPGEIDYWGGEVDRASRTLRIRARVPNPDGRLRAGMFVEVRGPGGGAPGRPAAAVPDTSLFEDSGRGFVFVRFADGWFVRRSAAPGRRHGGWVELLSGPPPGTVVAAGGAFLLKSDVLRARMGAGCAD